MRALTDVAAELGLHRDDVLQWGRHQAKIDLAALDRPASGKGKLVLVSAITPTPAGEGKTTTSIGLSMALRKLGTKVAVCLREPSLGPVFGVKGGGTGGGRAVIEPQDAINLHFTGDIHAIGSAHNLLAAMIDNDLYFGAHSGLDPRKVSWPRVLDMNDRALRNVVVGLQGEGVPRETRFDITAASEVMAVLGMAGSRADLRDRLGHIVVGKSREGHFVTANDIGAGEAMSALLTEAILPNLVQTAEGGPAIVHAGPFANIAHGCSSVLGTRLGMRYADVTVTEAGFGFDLGGEKFLDLKCRSAGLWPDAVVLVVTLRALRMHGGAAVAAAGDPSLERLTAGFANLAAHLDAAKTFGLTPVVAVNAFPNDPEDEMRALRAWCADRGVRVGLSAAFAKGGEGAFELAGEVLAALEHPRSEPQFAYPLEAKLEAKLEAVACKIYGADGVVIETAARKALDELERVGYGRLPVCMAKTFRSISDDQHIVGRPSGFRVTVRDIRLSAGAGFVVALLGDVMTMPGLPKRPAALDVRVDETTGRIRGLMRSE
ncbi:MAG: formate--tetrahydrofolate ligase [Sandaracinaceae bacterium]|nr:formate--tetrahydrofolate ligase [Sandaracinaceae bacterium]